MLAMSNMTCSSAHQTPATEYTHTELGVVMWWYPFLPAAVWQNVTVFLCSTCCADLRAFWDVNNCLSVMLVIKHVAPA